LYIHSSELKKRIYQEYADKKMLVSLANIIRLIESEEIKEKEKMKIPDYGKFYTD
jgi:hypothetical protein